MTRNVCRSRRRSTGFSLIELMIAVTVVAILAAIAWPSYTAYLARVRRGAARSSLVQTAQWLERAATTVGRYPAAAFIPPSLLRVEGGHYQVSARTTDTEFTLEAAPTGAQAADRCGTLTLSQTGERYISHAEPDATADLCWNR